MEYERIYWLIGGMGIDWVEIGLANAFQSTTTATLRYIRTNFKRTRMIIAAHARRQSNL